MSATGSQPAVDGSKDERPLVAVGFSKPARPLPASSCHSVTERRSVRPFRTAARPVSQDPSPAAQLYDTRVRSVVVFMKSGLVAIGPTTQSAATRVALIFRTVGRLPHNSPLRPDAMPIDHAGFYPFHQSNVARMRFGPPQVLDPDLLGPQKVQGRDVALIVADDGVNTGERRAWHPDGATGSGRGLDVRERCYTRQCRHPTNDAVVRCTDPPKLRAAIGRHLRIHPPFVPAAEVPCVADKIVSLSVSSRASGVAISPAARGRLSLDCATPYSDMLRSGRIIERILLTFSLRGQPIDGVAALRPGRLGGRARGLLP
jgi:hypothetical protein